MSANWLPASPEAVRALIDRHAGKFGGVEGETNITVANADNASGYLQVWSTRGADVAHMLKRAGSALIEYREIGGDGGSVWLRFRVDACRGPESLLKPLDIESKPFPRGVSVSA